LSADPGFDFSQTSDPNQEFENGSVAIEHLHNFGEGFSGWNSPI